MGFSILLPLRISQGIFAIIVMGLSSYIAHWYNVPARSASPSQINFLIFTSFFSILSIAYLELTPRFLSKAFNPLAALALELLTLLFYFAGFIALAVFLGKLLFCRGTVCSAARADVVFAAFGWVCWCATAAICGLEVWRGGSLKGLRGAKGEGERGRSKEVVGGV